LFREYFLTNFTIRLYKWSDVVTINLCLFWACLFYKCDHIW